MDAFAIEFVSLRGGAIKKGSGRIALSNVSDCRRSGRSGLGAAGAGASGEETLRRVLAEYPAMVAENAELKAKIATLLDAARHIVGGLTGPESPAIAAHGGD